MILSLRRLLILILLFVNSTTTTLKSSSLGEECVRFYLGVDYSSYSKQYCNDNTDLPHSLENRVSSVKVGAEMNAVLFENKEFEGEYRYLDGNKNILSGFTNKTSSFLLVKKGCIRVFSECNFKGESHQICSDTLNLDESLDFQVKSIVGSNSAIGIHQAANFEGPHYELASNTIVQCTDSAPELEGMTSFYFKTPLEDGCVMLYSDQYYTGTSTLICSDTTEIDVSVNSVRVSPSVSVNLFTQQNYNGTIKNIQFDSPDLAKFSLNSVNSAILVKENCIKLFHECNFQGISKQYCAKQRSFGNFHNDKFSSFVVGGKSFDLYQLTGYRGDLLVATPHSAKKCMEEFDNSLSSLIPSNEVRPNCVRFFSEENFNGIGFEHCNDTMELSAQEKNKFKSFKLGQNISILASNQAKLEGNLQFFSGNKTKFGNSIVKKVNSFILVTKGCIKVFRGCEFRGNQIEICNDRGKIPGFGNKISSFVSGGKFRVFSKTNFRGNSKLLGNEEFHPCMSQFNWNNKVSSIKKE